MKKIIGFGIFVMMFCLIGVTQAACHTVVDASDEYPDPRALEIDTLCIDDMDYVTLLKRRNIIYHFQSLLEVRNVGCRCVRTGRVESSRCGYNRGDLYLVFNDNKVGFSANVHEEEHGSGAQYLSFNDRRYKFWIRGRR